jgi:hypothetical protein
VTEGQDNRRERTRHFPGRSVRTWRRWLVLVRFWRASGSATTSWAAQPQGVGLGCGARHRVDGGEAMKFRDGWRREVQRWDHIELSFAGGAFLWALLWGSQSSFLRVSLGVRDGGRLGRDRNIRVGRTNNLGPCDLCE